MQRHEPSLRDWIATVPAISGVFAALIAHDPLQRVARVFGPDAHQRVVSSMARWCNHAVRLAGVTIRAEGVANVAPGQNYIIVSNHQSLLDISMTSEFLAALRPRYVSKRELARGVPGVSYNLRVGGSALIDRGDAAQARAAIETLARHVRDDHWSALIFPEGTRSKTGAMKPFRLGGLRALIEGAPGVPVLPVTTTGGSRIFQHNMAPIVRGGELVYRVHAPRVPPAPTDERAFEAFVADLTATIRGALPPADQDPA